MQEDAHRNSETRCGVLFTVYYNFTDKCKVFQKYFLYHRTSGLFFNYINIYKAHTLKKRSRKMRERFFDKDYSDLSVAL